MRKMDSFVNIIFFSLILSTAQASMQEESAVEPPRLGMMDSTEVINTSPSIAIQIQQLEEKGLLLKQQQAKLSAECAQLQKQKDEKQALFAQQKPTTKNERREVNKIQGEIKTLDETLKKKESELKDTLSACAKIANEIGQLESQDTKNGWEGGDLKILLDSSLSTEPTPTPSPSPTGSVYKVSGVPDSLQDKGKEEAYEVKTLSPATVVGQTVDAAKNKVQLEAIEAEAQNSLRKKAYPVGWVETACNLVVNNTSYALRLFKGTPLFPVGSYPSLKLSDVHEKFEKEWAPDHSVEKLKSLDRKFMFYKFPPFFINSSISTGKYFLPHGFYYGTVKIELADVELKLQLASLNLEVPAQDRTKLTWYKAILRKAEDASSLSGYVVNFTDKTRTCGPYEYLERIINCVEDIRTEQMYVNFQNSRRPSGYESTKTLMEMDFLAWDEEQKTVIFWGLCGLREENKLKGPSDYLERQKKALERRETDWPMLGGK